ncbi:serine/arginine repetitive matrix protein 2-like [Cygnus olor]|uniref:serine/arginine repetitive matrix protein 2-like n=1 Tax=Cygnus olor TaxID=8869 RepID=UPI001ADE1284|nr:serine/arginine repetitive matrix protein 2-like [Cygnus olor]
MKENSSHRSASIAFIELLLTRIALERSHLNFQTWVREPRLRTKFKKPQAASARQTERLHRARRWTGLDIDHSQEPSWTARRPCGHEPASMPRGGRASPRTPGGFSLPASAPGRSWIFFFVFIFANSRSHSPSRALSPSQEGRWLAAPHQPHREQAHGVLPSARDAPRTRSPSKAGEISAALKGQLPSEDSLLRATCRQRRMRSEQEREVLPPSTAGRIACPRHPSSSSPRAALQESPKRSWSTTAPPGPRAPQKGSPPPLLPRGGTPSPSPSPAARGRLCARASGRRHGRQGRDPAGVERGQPLVGSTRSPLRACGCSGEPRRRCHSGSRRV